jgi:hypothetical protein
VAAYIRIRGGCLPEAVNVNTTNAKELQSVLIDLKLNA